MRKTLRADQRPKGNHKDENLPLRRQEQYLLGKEFWPMLNQESIQSPILQCRRNQFIFFVMEVYQEKTMERLNSGENYLQDHFVFCHHLSDKVEERHGRRRRTTQENISVLCWFFRRNSTPSSSRSFRTQSHWSYYTGRCLDSERFLRVHLSRCAINLHSIISSGLVPGGQNLSNRQTYDRLEWNASGTMHAQSMEETSELGWSSIRHDRTLSFFTKHSQLIVFRKLLGWKLKKSYTRKICVTSASF